MRALATQCQAARRQAPQQRGFAVTISEQVIEFYENYPRTDIFSLPLQLHNPFDAPSRSLAIRAFYEKFYNDRQPRTHILGINPSRLTASSTGVHYTDGYALEEFCEIRNEFSKGRELTSSFFYEVVNRYGGANRAFDKIFAWAALPVALTVNGKYANYYEIKDENINTLVKSNIDWMASIPSNGRLVVLGVGENKDHLEQIDGFPFHYTEVIYLPHPRWILQYNRNKLDYYIELYLKAFG